MHLCIDFQAGLVSKPNKSNSNVRKNRLSAPLPLLLACENENKIIVFSKEQIFQSASVNFYTWAHLL